MWVFVVSSHIKTRVGISNKIIQKDKIKHTISLNDVVDTLFRPWTWRGGGRCGLWQNQ